MTWKEVLGKIEEEKVYTVSSLAATLGCTRAMSSSRVKMFRSWGYLKFKDQREGVRGGVVLTEYGRKIQVGLCGDE